MKIRHSAIEFEALSLPGQDEHLQQVLTDTSRRYKELSWAGSSKRLELCQDLNELLNYLNFLLSIRKKA